MSLEYSNAVDFLFLGLSYKSDVIVLSSVIEKIESTKLKN